MRAIPPTWAQYLNALGALMGRSVLDILEDAGREALRRKASRAVDG